MMIRFARLLFLSLTLPSLAFAAEGQSALSFTPPSTDFSMIFLNNIFGVVDGVLHGTGSQILGTMFSMFNSAVLALGGMVLMYTIIVSTLNTAHSGEVLGKRWSSLWIPMRSVFGVVLLLPKTSGYCLMQIFVMWVCVQGVGAADKIWNSALGYMQRGGVLVQPVASNDRVIAGTGIPSRASNGDQVSQSNGRAIIKAQETNAYAMLQSAVCLYTLQDMLQRYRESQLSMGQCQDNIDAWYCSPVPDLMGGIDFVGAGMSTAPTVLIPGTTSPAYERVQGLCGSITWKAWTESDSDRLRMNSNLSVDEGLMKQASQARSIAVQQMWLDMSTTAQRIVLNRFYNPPETRLPLGQTSADNVQWRSPFYALPTLLNGMEITGAASDYLGIMSPTLNVLSHSVKETSSFIEGAKADGWIMAGTYFFKVAKLNREASGYSGDNGFVKADSNPAFCLSCLQNEFPELFDASHLKDYSELLGSQTPGNGSCDSIDKATHNQSLSSYICNSLKLKSVGQLGMSPPQFVTDFKMSWQTIPKLPDQSFSGGFLGIPGFMATLFYKISSVIFNALITILNILLGIALELIFKPIIMMTIPYFTNGIETALLNYTNPIIAMTQVGANFINLSVAVWLFAMIALAALSAIPTMGTIGVTLAMFLMPFLATWLGSMFIAGATLAYYVPLLPYILFTFGALGWFIAVIEAMVAAPLVAFGVSHPEGDDVFGKSAKALMLLLNVFLRPGMMVLGFVSGIILAYVGIWFLNTGFQSAITGLLGPVGAGGVPQDELWAQTFGGSPNANESNVAGFAAIVGIIFMIVVYVSMYVAIVKTAIEKLMFKLADDILRWLDHQSEPLGSLIGQASGSIDSGVGTTAGSLKGAGSGISFPKGEGDGPSGGKGAVPKGPPAAPGGLHSASFQSGGAGPGGLGPGGGGGNKPPTKGGLASTA